MKRLATENVVSLVCQLSLSRALDACAFEDDLPSLSESDYVYVMQARLALERAHIPGDASREFHIIESALKRLAQELSSEPTP